MRYGVANYDYIIRKRDLFFQQRVYYDMYIQDVEGDLTFGYIFSIDVIETVPAGLEATLTLNSAIDLDVIDNVAIDLYGEDYFDGELNIIPTDINDLIFDYNIFIEAPKFKAISIYIYELKPSVSEFHINANVVLEAYSFAELGIDELLHFDYNFVITGVGIVDLDSLISSLSFTSSCQCLTVDFLEFGFTTESQLSGELTAIGIDIYEVIPQDILDYIESNISLDKVERYYDISETIEHHFGYDFPLDSYEIVEEGWEFLIHFDNIFTATSSETVDFGNLYESLNHDYEFEIDLVTEIQDFGFDQKVLNVGSSLTLDIISGYIYFDFLTEVMHFDGNIACFLMRDRYANNEEFLGLSTSTFLDLTIENFFEVNV